MSAANVNLLVLVIPYVKISFTFESSVYAPQCGLRGVYGKIAYCTVVGDAVYLREMVVYVKREKQALLRRPLGIDSFGAPGRI